MQEDLKKVSPDIKSEIKRIENQLKLEGREFRGDVFWESPEGNGKRIGIGYDLMGNRIRLGMSLVDAKEFVKRFNIKRIIDQDNNDGYIQSIYNFDYKNHSQSEYKIIVSLENKYENHSIDNIAYNIWSIIYKIKKGELDIDKVLSVYNR